MFAITTDRAIGLLALICIAVLSILNIKNKPEISTNFFNSGIEIDAHKFGLPILFLVVMLIAFFRHSIMNRIKKILSNPLRNKRTVKKLILLKKILFNLRKKILLLLGISLVAHLIPILNVLIFVGHIQPTIDVTLFFFVVPVSLLITALPIAIGGWGVRELSMAALFSMYGMPTDIAISCGIFLGLLNLVLGIIGAVIVFFFTPFKTLKSSRLKNNRLFDSI